MPSKSPKKASLQGAPTFEAAPSARAGGKAEDAESRRVPTQERSRQRVVRILDAAASVFAEQGHDAATMEAIAAKAETSIGSIYQFFPNKAAVFDALVRRYHGAIRAFLDNILQEEQLARAHPLGDIIDTSIDALTTLHETDLGFRAVWAGMHLTKTVVREGEALNQEIARRIAQVLAPKLPGLPASRHLLVATMVVEIVSAMLIFSARRLSSGEPNARRERMSETKLLLRRYLAPYEVPAGAPHSTNATQKVAKRSKRARSR